MTIETTMERIAVALETLAAHVAAPEAAPAKPKAKTKPEPKVKAKPKPEPEAKTPVAEGEPRLVISADEVRRALFNAQQIYGAEVIRTKYKEHVGGKPISQLSEPQLHSLLVLFEDLIAQQEKTDA